MSEPERERPPMLHLAGNSVACCGGWLLMLCDGVYKCPCGKVHTARANRILRGMGLESRPEPGRRLREN